MANLMDLVRELKQLNARKKAGEVLAPDEEARRRELKNYLKSALESQQGGGGGESEPPAEATAVKEPPLSRSTSIPSSMLHSAESSAPKPQPPVRGAPAAITMSPGAGARPLVEPLDPPASPSGRHAPVSLDPPAPASAPKPFVPKKDAYAIKGLDDLLGAAAQTAGEDPDADAPKFVADDIPLDEAAPPEAVEAPAGPPKPYVPKKDAFAIKGGGIDDLLKSAASSEAVAKADPWSSKKAKASPTELSEAEQAAERALRATKTRERPQNADEAAQQLLQIESQYTPPEDDFALEQYYGAYQEEGYAYVDEAAAPLAPIDSRELELAKATGAIATASTAAPASGATTATAPPGLAFLDDFPALYQKRVLPSPDEEIVIDSDDPNLLVPGKRKVTVHMLNGEKKMGAIRVLRRGDLGFRLEPQGSGMPEDISIAQCKAVFIHLQPNAQPKNVAGRPLTVTFKDQRQVQGASDDYQPGAPVFSLVPPAGRGQFERIIVNVAAVAAVR